MLPAMSLLTHAQIRLENDHEPERLLGAKAQQSWGRGEKGVYNPATTELQPFQ
jgi:hypothetical protein